MLIQQLTTPIAYLLKHLYDNLLTRKCHQNLNCIKQIRKLDYRKFYYPQRNINILLISMFTEKKAPNENKN